MWCKELRSYDLSGEVTVKECAVLPIASLQAIAGGTWILPYSVLRHRLRSSLFSSLTSLLVQQAEGSDSGLASGFRLTFFHGLAHRAGHCHLSHRPRDRSVTVVSDFRVSMDCNAQAPPTTKFSKGNIWLGNFLLQPRDRNLSPQAIISEPWNCLRRLFITY